MTTPKSALKNTQHYVLTKFNIENTPATKHVHQFNDNAIRHTVSLDLLQK